MAEEQATTTETTQTVPVTTATPGQGAASATVQGTTEKQTEQTETTETTQTVTQTTEGTTKPATAEKSPASVQERINRMYARLQSERAARERAEAALPARRAPTRTETEEVETEPIHTAPPGLTEVDVNNIIRRRESEDRYLRSEASVLERHPESLNEDGSYNLNDPFVKVYVDIGRRNPMLTTMENGPELAEAVAEKEMGLSYVKGRKDEAKRLAVQETNAHTVTSTTATPRATGPKVQISAVEKNIAARMGMTEEQYVAYKGNPKVEQRSWDSNKRKS